jgi:hypothetical protein
MHWQLKLEAQLFNRQNPSVDWVNEDHALAFLVFSEGFPLTAAPF